MQRAFGRPGLPGVFPDNLAFALDVERDDGTIQRIDTRRELILSGGTINSPVLLLASGIGPAAELAAEAVDVKLDLVGVGKNLQDHYLSNFAFKTRSPGTLNEAVMSPLKSTKMALQWLIDGSGQMAVGATEAILFANQTRLSKRPILSSWCTISRPTASYMACILGPASASSFAFAGRKAEAR